MSSSTRIRALMTNGSFWRMREEASSLALLIGLGFLLLVAALSTYLSWDTSYRSALARQANEIRFASLELLNAVQTEEIAARDFLITGDEVSLAAHARTQESLKGKFSNLAALSAQVGRHGNAMKTLADQIAVRTARFDEAADTRRTDGLDVVFGQEFQAVNEASLDEIGGLLRQMANTEMVNLVQSRSDTEIGRWWLGVGSVTSFMLSALLCAGALLLLRRSRPANACCLLSTSNLK